MSYRNESLPEFVEVGQFVVVSRVYPQRSSWFWMGRHRPGPLAAIQKRLTLSNLRYLRKAIHSSETKFIFAHVPVKSSQVQLRNFLRMFHGDFGGLAYRALQNVRNQPLVGLDFNDGVFLSSTALNILDRSVCFFKRELPTDIQNLLPSNASPKQRELLTRNSHKLMPISLGLCSDRMRKLPSVNVEKKFDLFFKGSLSSEVRMEELKVLDQLRNLGVRIDQPSEMLDQETFLRRCGESYLVWSPEGYGWDCFRHYESAAVGSVPVINRPSIQLYRPLEHDRHAIYYDSDFTSIPGPASTPSSGKGLLETIVSALADRQRLVAIGQEAQQHVFQYHTHQAIVDHILSSVKQCLIANSTDQLGKIKS